MSQERRIVGVVDVGHDKVLSGKETAIVRFHDFANLPQGRNQFIESGAFYCHGMWWSLRLYPHGNNNSENEYILAVFRNQTMALTGQPPGTPGGTAGTTAPPPPPPPPKRGGIHPTHGVFLGGTGLSGLDDDFHPKKAAKRLYRFTTQRRGAKAVGYVERALIDARDSTTTIKFGGKLEIDENSITELDKEQFVKTIKTLVLEHGHESFYVVKKGREVVDLFENLHAISTLDVIAE